MTYLEKEGFMKCKQLRDELGFSAYQWRNMEKLPGFPVAFQTSGRGVKYRRLSDVVAFLHNNKDAA